MDARELKDKASQLFSKGKFAKAAETYEQFCKIDQKDMQTRLRMGDAFAKAGNQDKAIAAYQSAAEGFAKEGFLPRAIAASKLVLELDPAHKGVQQMLADLYARKSTGARKPPDKPATQETKPVARAVELPPDEKGPPEKPEPVAAKPVDAPSPMNRADAIEIEVEEDSAPAGIEVELGSTERIVTGEVEVPIGDGAIDLGLAPAPPPEPRQLSAEPPPPPPAIELKLEPSAPAPVEAAPIVSGVEEPLASAPAPIVAGVVEPVPELAPIVAGVSEPVPPPPAIDPVIAGRAMLEDEDPAPPPPSAPGFELTVEEAPQQAAPSFELTVEPATPSADEPIELTPKTINLSPPATPAPPRSLQLMIEAAPPNPNAEVVELKPKAPAPQPAPSISPPGLRSRPDAAEAPRPAPRIWLGDASQIAPPAPSPSTVASKAKTDLERSLQAFSMFDVDAPVAPVAPRIPVAVPPPAPVAPPPAAVKPAKSSSFTELDLDEPTDTLLHAIEAASVPVSSPSALLSVEEVMEAADDAKLEPGALPKIPLFSDLPEDAFIALFEQCPLRRFEPGDRIIRQGSVGDSFFVICSGSVKVMREDGGHDREVAALEEGAFFGEMALLSDSPRTASVDAAAEDTQLLEISGAVLKQLSAQHPSVSAALKKFCRQRLLANLMNSAPLFRPFSKGDRRELVQKFRAREVGASETILREGHPSDGLYVVLSGEVAVLAQGKRVAVVKEGEVFGEMSLLTRGPATASIMSTKRTSLLRLPRDDFDRLIMSHPQILELVAELTDTRRRQNATLAEKSNATDSMV